MGFDYNKGVAIGGTSEKGAKDAMRPMDLVKNIRAGLKSGK